MILQLENSEIEEEFYKKHDTIHEMAEYLHQSMNEDCIDTQIRIKQMKEEYLETIP
jgi:hypothetical protein